MTGPPDAPMAEAIGLLREMYRADWRDQTTAYNALLTHLTALNSRTAMLKHLGVSDEIINQTWGGA